jgi:cell division septation protein DedD
MANKDFREIQVSSTLLVVIFLGVLALGVFIFLLGVSVGKKQAAVAAPTQIVTQQIPEEVKAPAIKPTATETASDDAGPATAQETAKPPAKETTSAQSPATKPPTATKKTTAAGAPAASGLYYVQVAAFSERAPAQALADKYKGQGYTTFVTSRVTSTKTWYRVRLGGYPTRDKAVDLLAKLNAAAGKKTDFQIVHD